MSEQNKVTTEFLPIGCNPYGFRLNINHPRINELYRRYKRWKGLAENYPITDKQRQEFENYVINSVALEITPRQNKK